MPKCKFLPRPSTLDTPQGATENNLSPALHFANRDGAKSARPYYTHCGQRDREKCCMPSGLGNRRRSFEGKHSLIILLAPVLCQA